MIIPAFLDLPIAIAVGAPAIAFAALCWQLFRGVAAVPMRFKVVFWLCTALAVCGYVIGWSYGVKYQGFTHTVGCALAASMMATAVALLVHLPAKNQRSFASSLAAQALFFVFVVTYAFPYLGEGT